MPTATVKRGTRVERRESGYTREVIGFTTKPDGIRRARLVDIYDPTNETLVKVDQITKTYKVIS